MSNPPVSPWPNSSKEEIAAVTRVLMSNRVNYWSGNEGRQFESEFASFCDVEHAVAVANGTVALDLALRALNIGPGDEVIVTPRTFFASVSCIVNVGATPVFAEVCPDSQNITPTTVARVISPATRAIIAVHLAGWPCDMDGLMALADQHRLAVIEDCAQAHGARYKGRPVGGLGHIGCWSFCQDKIMTTGGEGGMVTTNDRQLWSKMWSYKDHGKCWHAVHDREHPNGFRWLHESFGTNGRMTEMQAAIGRIQLRYMPEWSRLRRENARRLLDTCAEFSLFRVPEAPAEVEHANYKCYVFVEPDQLPRNWGRDHVIELLRRHGVHCMQGSWSEVYLERAFDGTGLRPVKRLPVARRLGETSIMFVVHPTLTEREVDAFCAGIRKVGALAGKQPPRLAPVDSSALVAAQARA